MLSISRKIQFYSSLIKSFREIRVSRFKLFALVCSFFVTVGVAGKTTTQTTPKTETTETPTTEQRLQAAKNYYQMFEKSLSDSVGKIEQHKKISSLVFDYSIKRNKAPNKSQTQAQTIEIISAFAYKLHLMAAGKENNLPLAVLEARYYLSSFDFIGKDMELKNMNKLVELLFGEKKLLVNFRFNGISFIAKPKLEEASFDSTLGVYQFPFYIKITNLAIFKALLLQVQASKGRKLSFIYEGVEGDRTAPLSSIQALLKQIEELEKRYHLNLLKNPTPHTQTASPGLGSK